MTSISVRGPAEHGTEQRRGSCHLTFGAFDGRDSARWCVEQVPVRRAGELAAELADQERRPCNQSSRFFRCKTGRPCGGENIASGRHRLDCAPSGRSPVGAPSLGTGMVVNSFMLARSPRGGGRSGRAGAGLLRRRLASCLVRRALNFAAR